MILDALTLLPKGPCVYWQGFAPALAFVFDLRSKKGPETQVIDSKHPLGEEKCLMGSFTGTVPSKIKSEGSIGTYSLEGD